MKRPTCTAPRPATVDNGAGRSVCDGLAAQPIALRLARLVASCRRTDALLAALTAVEYASNVGGELAIDSVIRGTAGRLAPRVVDRYTEMTCGRQASIQVRLALATRCAALAAMGNPGEIADKVAKRRPVHTDVLMLDPYEFRIYTVLAHLPLCDADRGTLAGAAEAA
jgi:hypothetical protein